MWAIFTDEGIPRWFGPAPVEGSEFLDPSQFRDLLPAGTAPEALPWLLRDILVRHMRQDGRWLPRPTLPVPEPEIAAESSDLVDEPIFPENESEG